MSIVMTKDLAQRIEQSELQALESRLLAIKEIKGNPMDIEIKKSLVMLLRFQPKIYLDLPLIRLRVLV